jgi:hypothetical protein
LTFFYSAKESTSGTAQHNFSISGGRFTQFPDFGQRKPHSWTGNNAHAIEHPFAFHLSSSFLIAQGTLIYIELNWPAVKFFLPYRTGYQFGYLSDS